VEVPLESSGLASKRIRFEVFDVWVYVPQVANGKDTGKADIDGNDHHTNGESDIYGIVDINEMAYLLLLRSVNTDRRIP
jgi:hypothetical protein